jgi:glycosyltransferase involved in cell wall biosynthesis
VVLCTFNRAPLLPRALDSLLEQEEPAWEAVVVDDGSTDGTAELVREYVDRDPRIRYLYHRRRGLALSRNTGAAAAAGRFVTFLDSDDRYEPGHLAARRRRLEEDPSADFLHGGFRVIGSPYVPDMNDPTRLVHLDECVVGATFVLPPETLAHLGGFPDRSYACDGKLFESAVRAGLRIVKVDEPTYVYDRTSSDSQCNRLAEENDAKRSQRWE